MRSFTEAQDAREHAAANTPEDRIARNQCPVCPGELDTGYECLDCGYDAAPTAAGESE